MKKTARPTVLLDFTVRAPGGSTTYAEGFLDALAALAPQIPARLVVLVPAGPESYEALHQAGCRVVPVIAGPPGTWRGRSKRSFAVIWRAWRERADVVFVPREAAPPLVRGRLVVLARNLLVWQPRDRRRSLAERARTAAARRAVARADAVIVPTAAFGLALPRSDLRVIPYGSNIQAVDVTDKHGCWLSGGRVLQLTSIGTVSRHKHHELAIDVAACVAKHVPCHLTIWGSTPDRQWAEELRTHAVARLGYDALAGELAPAARRDALAQTDVLIVASATESFGFPLVEGMRTSCAVLAPDAPLTREVCGNAALLFPEGSAEKAAQQVLDSLDRLREVARAAYGRGGAFEWSRCTSATLAVLTAAAPSRSGSRTSSVRLRTALADLRALGTSGAVARAGYEAFKRARGHALLLRTIAPKRSSAPTRPVFCEVGNDELKVFDRHVQSCERPDWHLAIETDARWPRVSWWKIDLRSEKRIADVKWTWELGRHAHLVVLARTASLGDGDAFDALTAQLRSWLEQNPPEVGVHWYSNLEIALRAIAWAQILGLVGDRLDPGLHQEMAATLRHAGRHMLVELPYTVSSMRNNHLLGDALGMIVIGEMFPTTREGRFLRRVGNRMFRKQLSRQVHEDGSMIEDSISYHRFVTEMLAMRTLLPAAEDDTREALLRAAQFMFRLGVGEGEVPQYGDWDEGRVLAVAENRTDLLGSARVALALAGTGAPEEWREAHEEVAWYVGEGEPAPPQPAERDGHDVGGGIGRAARGPFTAWLKVGSQPSHGHADLCSTPVLFDGTWLVVDPGTGTYNGPIEQRNYFRCSIAHNVLRVEELDQLEPHRAFRWLHSAQGVVGPPLEAGDAVVMWGVHDAYRRLRPARRVARVVVLSDASVVAADWVEGPPTAYAMSFPLHPTVEWNDGKLVLPDGRCVRLDLPGEPSRRKGQAAPYDGWWSRTYGHAEPATRLEVHGVTAGPVAWSLRAGSSVPVAVEGNRLRVGDDGFEIRWRENGAALTHLRAGGGEQSATVALG